MRKISEIIKSQATTEFKQRKQQIIKQTLHKNYKDKPNFQEILNLYIK